MHVKTILIKKKVNDVRFAYVVDSIAFYWACFYMPVVAINRGK